MRLCRAAVGTGGELNTCYERRRPAVTGAAGPSPAGETGVREWHLRRQERTLYTMLRYYL